jgi:iron complex outermembrane receptor protein
MVWGGVSRAVRMPTRIDSDLRFTAGTPFVVIAGNPDFQSETVIATEIGYRARIIPRTAFGVTTFVNSYDDLRSQEPTPPLGIPIVIGNKENARVGGVEAAVTVEPVEAWQLHVSYSRLVERFSYDADSRDPTGGALEHNDPPHQLRLRSYTDLPGHVSLDLTMRWVDALPKPAVPAYAELTIRVARPLGRQLELELVGDNLLHDRHLEFVNLGPPHAVPRSVFARVTWRSR